MDRIDKINAQLLKRGMSGRDLEAAIQVSHSVYSQWNTRQTTPSNKSLKKCADVFGIPVEELLEDETKKEPTHDGVRLSADEWQLLELYKQLNTDGQKQCIRYIQRILLPDFSQKNHSDLVNEVTAV